MIEIDKPRREATIVCVGEYRSFVRSCRVNGMTVQHSSGIAYDPVSNTTYRWVGRYEQAMGLRYDNVLQFGPEEYELELAKKLRDRARIRGWFHDKKRRAEETERSDNAPPQTGDFRQMPSGSHRQDADTRPGMSDTGT